MGFMSNTAFALKSTGIVTSLLAIDIGLLVLILFVSKNLLIPVASSFKKAKSLDALAGAAPRHWFYGHAKQVRNRIFKNSHFVHLPVNYDFNEALRKFILLYSAH